MSRRKSRLAAAGSGRRERQLALRYIEKQQHFTQPPARYTEATLVKAMEEKGVGRPSTYAATVSTIQDREYVIKQDKRLMPHAPGRGRDKADEGALPGCHRRGIYRPHGRCRWTMWKRAK